MTNTIYMQATAISYYFTRKWTRQIRSANEYVILISLPYLTRKYGYLSASRYEDENM